MSDDFEDNNDQDYTDKWGDSNPFEDEVTELDDEGKQIPKEFGDDDDDDDDDPAVTRLTPRIREITGADRKTRNFMTRFEYGRLVGVLASMITIPGFSIDPLVKCTSDNPLDIAEAWLDCRDAAFPISVKRPVSNDAVEIWEVSELILPSELETYFEQLSTSEDV